MADENTGADDDIKDDSAESDASTEDTKTDDGGEDAGKSADDKADDDGADDDAGGDDKGDKKADKGKDDDDDKEPPVRRGDNASFIIARKNAKIAKMSGKDKGGDKSGSDAGEGDDEEEDGLGDADRTAVQKEIQKALKPLAEKFDADADTNALNDFFKDPKNAHFKPYEAKVRKWAVHSSRRNLPIRTVALEIAGDDLMKIGADKGKQADTKARKDQAGGGKDGKEATGADQVWKMPAKDFAAQQEEVRRKQRE